MLSGSVVYGHAGERGFVMLLPTTEWIVTGTLIVVVTFCILLLAPRNFSAVAFQKAQFLLQWKTQLPKAVLGTLFLLLYLILIAAGLFGSNDPLENPIGPVMWSWFWVGMVFLHLLFGNLWLLINPFEIADSLLLKLFPGFSAAKTAVWPRWLGYWPAVGLLVFLTWFENVSLSPYDPGTLAWVMIGYLLVTLLGMRYFGRTQWLQYGEVFSVYFRMISWLAPVRWQESGNQMQVSLKWPVAGLLEVGRLPLSATIFVLVALACVTFDGASHTYWWLSIWHINPLEFGGRSTVYWQNTLGLIAACVALILLYVVSSAVFKSEAAHPVSGQTSGFSALAVSLVPIAFGYHLAHYLPAFALESQYALSAVSDPVALGWDLFGTSARPVIASVRSSFDAIATIWVIQMVAIVLSHVISVMIAHLVIEREFGGNHLSRFRQLPYALLMIAYTFMGLWLLSTASL